MTRSVAALTPLLACPACGSSDAPLSARAVGLACRDCGARFPVHDSGRASVPWLFANPGATLAEWQARLNGFLNSNAAEQARLQTALADEYVGKTGRKRIRRLLHARREQRAQVIELLAPLRLDANADGAVPNPASSLHDKLPKSQGLTNYYANIFRDWAWDNGENEHLVGAIESALAPLGQDRLGKTLTLGAGACRLAYDIHRAHSPELSVALDINPLFMFLASRVMHGDTVPLHEFPVAPLNDASFTALRECRAPQALADAGEFMFVCADAMNPPFAAGSFDTVITPWLIDVIPQNLREFIPRVNQLLKKGGTWLNTGSLAFFHKDESWCYSQEEVVELLQKNGFEILSATRSDVPYLQSPLSAHKRMESVFSFGVRKRRDVETPKRYEYLPDWMRDTTRPIPELTEFVVASSNHLLQTQTLAAIDGERTIEQIGQLVASQYGLQVDDATHAVKRILVDIYEAAVI